jgi:proteasome beta subunit
LHGAYSEAGSSFVDHLRGTAPHLLPGRVPPGTPADAAARLRVPHGTTIVALSFADGVLIAGDRRATSGNVIAQHDLEKVLLVDEHSAAGFAGSVGTALQMLRLFSVEVEEYEKLEGTPISLPGKARRLAALVRDNLEAAQAGFVAMPLLVGHDVDEPDPSAAYKIISFDPTGDVVVDRSGYEAIGSGSPFAKSALKKRHSRHAGRDEAVRTALEALYDAADDDTATGGPDLARRIYPVVAAVTAGGAEFRPVDEIEELVRAIVADRRDRPGG